MKKFNSIPELSLAVREIISEKGWFTFATYNNGHGKYRQMKYMGNGWRVPTKTKKTIIAAVKKIVPKSFEVSFREAMSWRGPYDYLEILIPNDEIPGGKKYSTNSWW